MNPDLFLRQLDIIHPNQLTMRIVIIGAGGIGSWTALVLAKMGCSDLTIFDDDNIEPQNVGCQFYVEKEIGDQKVTTLAGRVTETTGVVCTAQPEQVTAENVDYLKRFDYVIGAVDNIETRKLIFDGLKGTNVTYIDGRMSAEIVQVFTTRMNNPESITFYEDSLFPADEAEEAPCTAQAVAYNCFMVAGTIGSIIAKSAMNKPVPKEIIIDLVNYELNKSS